MGLMHDIHNADCHTHILEEEPDTFHEIVMLKNLMICSKILRLIGLGGRQEGLLLMYFLWDLLCCFAQKIGNSQFPKVFIIYVLNGRIFSLVHGTMVQAKVSSLYLFVCFFVCLLPSFIIYITIDKIFSLMWAQVPS